jgi:hypothetical protein
MEYGHNSQYYLLFSPSPLVDRSGVLMQRPPPTPFCVRTFPLFSLAKGIIERKDTPGCLVPHKPPTAWTTELLDPLGT